MKKKQLKKNKIVYLVNALGLDGTSQVVMTIFKHFQAEYELHVITLNQNREVLRNVILPSSVYVHSFNISEDTDYSLISYLRNLFFVNRWRVKYRKVIDLIQVLNPAIIHAHLQPRELMIIHALKKVERFKLLYTDHSLRIKRDDYRWLNRQLLAWVYRRIYRIFNVVAVSKQVYDYHVHFNLIGRRKFHKLIVNRVNTEYFVPSSHALTKPIRVIYVARLHQKKGHDTLIKAWSLIKHSFSLELILVGGGDDEARLKQLHLDVGSAHPITFKGDVTDVLAYLQSSDIGVFPSLNEGLPISLLEKMSCGLPVIVSNIPEFKEIINDNENGLFFEAGNFKELAQKLNLLIADSSLRKRLGESARQVVVENYSQPEFKIAYQNIYNLLLS